MARVPKFTVRPGRPAATGFAALKPAGHEDVPLLTARMAGVPPAAQAAGLKHRGEGLARPAGVGTPASKRPTRPTRGSSISTTATPTPTTRPTTTSSVLCVAEREQAGQPPRAANSSAHASAGLAPEPHAHPFGLKAVWRAYQACRRGKRTARDTQAYEAHLLDKLVGSRDALASASWRPSRTFSFVVSRPKLREIHAAPFADRVVHHVIADRLARLYEPVFIHDSYANRLGKGTHAAVERLQTFMRSVTQGGAVPAFALQLDIANFFNSIHRPTLFRLLQHRLARAVRGGTLDATEAATLQSLCRALLQTDPTQGVRRRGAKALFDQVPPHKRLGALGPHTGLPIGNLTSQFFANVYLNELDQFVKHTCKCRHYVRFVDDFVLLHTDAQQLLAWRGQIEAFLAQNLSLRLKALNGPHPLQQGTDFLGYVVRPHYRLARRRVVQRMQTCLRQFERLHVRAHALRLPPAAVQHLRAQLASYVGHLRHANSLRLWQRTLAQHPWLRTLFTLPQPLALGQPRWEPQTPTSLAGQHAWCAQAWPGVRPLVQVGNACLLAGPLPRGLPKGQAVARPGLGPCTEWPLAQLPRLRQRLKALAVPHAVLAQVGHCKTGFKRRALVALWRPRAGTPDQPNLF